MKLSLFSHVFRVEINGHDRDQIDPLLGKDIGRLLVYPSLEDEAEQLAAGSTVLSTVHGGSIVASLMNAVTKEIYQELPASIIDGRLVVAPIEANHQELVF